MGVVVIGGQSSGVGKTTVICGLIQAMPERGWTAIKITQCSHEAERHGDDGSDQRRCDCELQGGEFAVSEERDRTASTDTSRYLAAGAVRALWIRTTQGHLCKAMLDIEQTIASAENVVIESNSVLEFLQPDVYALVVSPGVADFKPSARRYMERADAVLLAEAVVREKEWPDELESRVPRFSMDAAPAEFIAWVQGRIAGAGPIRE